MYIRVTLEGELMDYESIVDIVDQDDWEERDPSPIGRVLSKIGHVVLSGDLDIEIEHILKIKIEEIDTPKQKPRKRRRY